MVTLNELPEEEKERWRAEQRLMRLDIANNMQNSHARVVRFLATGNAGGTVVVLTFMGALLQKGLPVSSLIMPLALFLVGICFAGASAIVVLARNNERLMHFSEWRAATETGQRGMGDDINSPPHDNPRRVLVRVFIAISTYLFASGLSLGLMILGQLP